MTDPTPLLTDAQRAHVAAERLAQGLPARIEDDRVYARIAEILDAPKGATPKPKRAAS